MVDPIAISIPGFFAAMGVEFWVARRRGLRVYRLADALTDVSCGVTSQVEGFFSAAIQLAAYAWVFEHARFLTLGGWQAWVVAFLGVDFFYYWWHRLSHERNVLWAAHVVHHQSEDYNLAVALRQSVTTGWTSLPFYLPLAVLGVPTLVYAVVHALSTLYQFWIHTELVGKTKSPIRFVLNLPEHHRVHHAINPQYLDKNYAATLIIWDRLFGTFAAEEERCVYGITTPIRSYNPLWAQCQFWVWLVRQTFALRGQERLGVWFASPAWHPAGASKRPFDDAPRTKFDVVVDPSRARYVLAQYAVLLIATTALVFVKATLSQETVLVASLAIIGGVTALGGLLERRGWAKPLEVSRIALSAVAVLLLILHH